MKTLRDNDSRPKFKCLNNFSIMKMVGALAKSSVLMLQLFHSFASLYIVWSLPGPIETPVISTSISDSRRST
jgi:hypothetical protein